MRHCSHGVQTACTSRSPKHPRTNVLPTCCLHLQPKRWFSATQEAASTKVAHEKACEDGGLSFAAGRIQIYLRRLRRWIFSRSLPGEAGTQWQETSRGRWREETFVWFHTGVFGAWLIGCYDVETCYSFTTLCSLSVLRGWTSQRKKNPSPLGPRVRSEVAAVAVSSWCRGWCARGTRGMWPLGEVDGSLLAKLMRWTVNSIHWSYYTNNRLRYIIWGDHVCASNAN